MKPSLGELLSRIKSLEPMPEVALRVLQLSQRSDVVPGDLIASIQTEPALTAKILRLVNSAYYGFARQIASLEEAGNLLGTRSLTNLVLTSCGARYFHDCPTRDSKRRKLQWRRSVSYALSSSLLARITRASEPGRAYTAALLQDVGELVLDGLPKELALELERELAAGTPRLEAEERVYGLHHAEIGARLAGRWNFPELLIEALRCHHAPAEATGDREVVDLVHLGAQVADEIERENAGDGRPAYALSGPSLANLGLDAVAMEALRAPLKRELAKAQALVDAD